MSSTLDLAIDLIGRQSLTPNDAGCQTAIAERLKACDFKTEHLDFEDVHNLWAKRGEHAPLIVFAGHTDVVPTGPLDAWQTPPFTPSIRDGYLYGRGAADMKSGLAAMVTAAEQFIKNHPNHQGSIAFLLTSDEEGPGINGTARVLQHLVKSGEHVDYCLVGEPTSVERLGDTIKIGRRGSLNGTLTVYGVQGHIAYADSTSNPIHLFAQPLADLCSHKWDHGNEFFQPTSFQVSNIRAGVGATNVVPGALELMFNFRFSTETTAEKLKETVEEVLRKHHLDYTIDWALSGNPFLTPTGKLSEAAQAAIKAVRGYTAEVSTSGGTSDARFFAPLGAEVVELGPVNATMHKLDENVNVDDLSDLSAIYEKILVSLLA